MRDVKAGQSYSLSGITLGLGEKQFEQSGRTNWDCLKPFWEEETPQQLRFIDAQGIEWTLPMDKIPEFLTPEGRARFLKDQILGQVSGAPEGTVTYENGKVSVNGLAMPRKPKPRPASYGGIR